MIEGLLMAAAKRRAAGGGDITIIEEMTATGANPSVTFSATPADGERIVLLAGINAGGASLAMPGAFGSIIRHTSGTALIIECASHVAASEAGATYTVTTSSVASFLYAVRLSACSVGDSGSNGPFNATSSEPLSTPINVADNSYVVCGWVMNGLTSGVSIDESFLIEGGGILANRGYVASRKFNSGQAGVSPTLSWTTSRGQIAILAEFNP